MNGLWVVGRILLVFWECCFLNLVEKIKKHSWTIPPESSHLKYWNKFHPVSKNRKEKIDFKAKTISWKNKENFVLSRKSHCVTFFRFWGSNWTSTWTKHMFRFGFNFFCYFFVNEILCVESSFWIAFEFFEVRGVFQGDWSFWDWRNDRVFFDCFSL